jgi:hypothetical protein
MKNLWIVCLFALIACDAPVTKTTKTPTHLSRVGELCIEGENTTIYENCGNIITLSYTNEEENFDYYCKARGGEVKQSTSNKHKYLLVPTSKSYYLDIYYGQDTILIQTFHFEVKAFPYSKTPFELWLDGKRTKDKFPQTYKGQSMNIRLRFDSIHQKLYKRYNNDMHYGFEDMEVYVQLKNTDKITFYNKVQAHGDITEGTCIHSPNPETMCDCKPCTLHYVLQKVFRRNFKGEKFPLDLTEKERTFSLIYGGCEEKQAK